MDTQPAKQKIDLGITSCLIFLIVLILWLAISQPWIERYIILLSDQAERLFLTVILILPSLIGAVLGGIAIVKPKNNKVLAVTGFLLTTLQTLHFVCTLAFAG